jgi:uncharacterized damage-inducible protein DinB
MADAAFYRNSFEHEIAANHAMLKMIAGVPEGQRTDPRFQRAVNIAAHMCACRTNYLASILGDDSNQRPWFEERADLSSLPGDFEQMEGAWMEYLRSLGDGAVSGSFTFTDNGARWRLSLEAQLFQLLGHAAYHRGQVALLVDQLGGETVDTDYIEWFTEHFPDGWGRVE